MNPVTRRSVRSVALSIVLLRRPCQPHRLQVSHQTGAQSKRSCSAGCHCGSFPLERRREVGASIGCASLRVFLGRPSAVQNTQEIGFQLVRKHQPRGMASKTSEAPTLEVVIIMLGFLNLPAVSGFVQHAFRDGPAYTAPLTQHLSLRISTTRSAPINGSEPMLRIGSQG